MTQIKASINSNVCLLITSYMTIKEMGINPGNVKDIKYERTIDAMQIKLSVLNFDSIFFSYTDVE